jgi:alginate O-acetyltransferase complex protein AlgI
MLFNSYIFIFAYLPITLLIFYSLKKYDTQNYLIRIFLIISSLVFYFYSGLEYFYLIITLILLNFFIGKIIYKLKYTNFSKLFLYFGIFTNLLILFYYKYFNFFVENINTIFNYQYSNIKILLPLAISFFIFQKISFLIDIYTNKTTPSSFLSYTLFVIFFPPLIAGPIVRHNEIAHQFENPKFGKIDYLNIYTGLSFFIIGLAKKILIADNLAEYVSIGYDKNLNLNMIEAWLLILCFSMQLYYDFSGYSDMAIGIAKMFNIDLPINFNSPYKAKNIKDFWRRWHISLSNFLRDYIYIPLGGNNNSIRNILIVFIIGGIWHGASWSFILWGLIHGFGYILLELVILLKIKLNRFISVIFTFIFVSYAWIFFRANNIDTALSIIKDSLNLNSLKIPFFLKKYFDIDSSYFGSALSNTSTYINNHNFLYILVLAIILLFFKNSVEIINAKYHIKYNYIIILISLLCLFSISKESTFLYFNF